MLLRNAITSKIFILSYQDPNTLFTRAVTRALHLEIVDSLVVDDFLLAFRRFVARRALPNIIYSDNAKTFKAAKSLLQSYFCKEIVWWKNICPLSPNWGGWWERLVRSVKSALKKTLGKSSVSRRELASKYYSSYFWNTK